MALSVPTALARSSQRLFHALSSAGPGKRGAIIMIIIIIIIIIINITGIAVLSLLQICFSARSCVCISPAVSERLRRLR